MASSAGSDCLRAEQRVALASEANASVARTNSTARWRPHGPSPTGWTPWRGFATPAWAKAGATTPACWPYSPQCRATRKARRSNMRPDRRHAVRRPRVARQFRIRAHDRRGADHDAPLDLHRRQAADRREPGGIEGPHVVAALGDPIDGPPRRIGISAPDRAATITRPRGTAATRRRTTMPSGPDARRGTSLRRWRSA